MNMSDTNALTIFQLLYSQCYQVAHTYGPMSTVKLLVLKASHEQPVNPVSESDFVEQSVLLSDSHSHSLTLSLSLSPSPSPVESAGSSPGVEKSISHCVIYHIFTLVEPCARSTAVRAHKQRN